MPIPLAYMNTPQPAKKDNARKAEEMFKTMIEGFARNGQAQGRPFTIEVEPNIPDKDGGTHNRYKVPGEGGAELIIEFRNFTVAELSGNRVTAASIHSPQNMMMITSITMGDTSNTLAFVLYRMNDIIRKKFSAGHCYYVMQHKDHTSHYFFYNDTTDNSMVVVKFKMGFQAIKQSRLC